MNTDDYLITKTKVKRTFLYKKDGRRDFEAIQQLSKEALDIAIEEILNSDLNCYSSIFTDIIVFEAVHGEFEGNLSQIKKVGWNSYKVIT